MNGRPERKGYEEITYQQHRERINTMKPTIDCGPPRAHPFSNKNEMEKQRFQNVVEMDNRLMLERLAKVVQNKSIDNEIHKSVAMHAQFKKKLGLTKKRLEMQRLTEENQRLLKRIQEVPPAYNHLKWEEDARANREIMKNMTLYPEILEIREKKEAQTKTKRPSYRRNTSNVGNTSRQVPKDRKFDMHDPPGSAASPW
jgi:hypothetical protein